MHRLPLVQDCASCAAVCCTASAFYACEDFAYDKPAGAPCRHLRSDFGCEIYLERAARGFAGCAQFVCYGAGPRATALFGGADMPQLIRGFSSLLAVCEMIWLLCEAQRLVPLESAALAAALEREAERLRAIHDAEGAALLALDPSEVQRAGRDLLRQLGGMLGGGRRLHVRTA